MPQKILCAACGCVLYSGDILKSPQDVAKKYEGKCPDCGKRLDFALENVEIGDHDSAGKNGNRRETGQDSN